LKLTRAPSAASSEVPRATSGGRAIMAEGQPWPICPYCEARLALYLQFDIEGRFGLAFEPGSHLLLFHCPLRDHVPLLPSAPEIPAAWIQPDFQASWRIILNPPGTREVVHEADPVVLEQRVAFTAAEEKVSQGLDGPIGKNDVKVGGIPHWVQPP